MPQVVLDIPLDKHLREVPSQRVHRQCCTRCQEERVSGGVYRVRYIIVLKRLLYEAWHHGLCGLQELAVLAKQHVEAWRIERKMLMRIIYLMQDVNQYLGIRRVKWGLRRCCLRQYVSRGRCVLNDVLKDLVRNGQHRS